jgi:hypothetical protein
VRTLLTIAVSGLGNKADVLDFLIDRVLQKFVKLLNFLFDLGDVREFDFDGCTEAVAAVLRQSELLAVVGAEFDCHDVWFWWYVGTKKPDLESLADRVVLGCVSPMLFLTAQGFLVSSASFRVVA